MTEIVGSKRRINVVAQGLEDIVLDPGTITGYRSKAHRIAMFLRKHFNPELTRPNIIHPSKSKNRPKEFLMPCCEKLDSDLFISADTIE